MKYRCNNCGAVFDEPHLTETTYAEHYGIPMECGGYIHLTISLCPFCDWDELEIITEDEEE